MKIVDSIFDNLTRAFVYIFLLALVLIVLYLTVFRGYMIGIAFSLIPIAIVIFVKFIDKPLWTFTILFIVNYYISGLSRYVTSISPGLYMDAIIVLTLLVMIMQMMRKESEVKFRNIFNLLTLVTFIWFAYCILQLLNPNSSSPVAWLTNVRSIGVYFLIITVITSAFMTHYSYLKKFLIAWAILCLTAVLKAWIQKNIGFDFAETRWLNAGGSSTHIIHSGTRYFSFFTDAANFGTGIGFSMMVFAITALYIESKKLKVFFFATALACFYGMIISGTRGSLAVPLVGLAVISFISRNIKVIVITSLVLLLSFIFLRYTNYGQGNSYIRRMRSAFNTEDASLLVRQENQRKLATYMASKPFGGGIGMSRSENVSYKADSYISAIPTDGWYVLIWIETGIVGLVMYVGMLVFIFLYGMYIVLFKLKNHELKGITAAFVAAIGGVFVSSYSIEIMGQFPNSFIIFICMTFIFLSPKYDKELSSGKES